MNEYQQKAEQYVRGQLPELKELSFGCEIVVAGIARDNPGCERDVVLYGTQEQWDKGFVPTEYYGQVPRSEIEKIIGHPIQLQHWLRVMALDPSLADSMGFVEADFGISHSLIFQFKGKDIRFFLLTGQPATEEDYQAFCEIVGIKE